MVNATADMRKDPTRERYVAIKEAADHLGVKVSWIYSAVESGRLPAFRIGRYLRFRLTDLDHWAAKSRTDSESSRWTTAV